MCDERQREIERFLYREARLLDERRFREWLDLFTDDVRYWMPARTTRYAAGTKALSVLDPERDRSDELSREGEMTLLDDSKATLTMRVARLETGLAWSEDPPSRTRHLVTNIEVEDGDREDEVRVYSAFLVHRNRLETEVDLFVGRREDVLRKVDGFWRVAQRKIILDQNVLLSKNLSIFF
jgi:3-phenylpropionate/cinnamic acid dioxygenase small subunit